MENVLEMTWVYNTSWDKLGFGKINVNYIIK
jgi:hypothetical protein